MNLNEKNVIILYNRKSHDRLRSDFIMVFKVYYQERITEVPVREKTKVIYVEGETVKDVRNKIADRGYNVEHVQAVTGAYLEYERQNEDYNVLEI